MFSKDLEEAAAAFVQRLSADDAGRYVGIIGAGPAGLRATELIVALNRRVPEAERRKVLLFDRNPVPSGLGAYGIPPVHKQGNLKDGIVQQVQGIMHGKVGRREWRIFPRDRFLQVIDSPYVRFFPHTNVGVDIFLEQFERLGIPLLIATGAQQPRLPTDAQDRVVPGRQLANVITATSEFFRAIGTTWLRTSKDVHGLTYDGAPHDLRRKRVVMVYGGGNVASDAFMWAFRNTPPATDVLLVYRGELHAMSNMSRPYYKPLDTVIRQRRAASPLLTPEDVLDVAELSRAGSAPQRAIEQILHQALLATGHEAATPTLPGLVEAMNHLLRTPGLLQRLPHLERGSLRMDLHAVFTAQREWRHGGHAEPAELLLLNRTLLELEYPNALRRLHRAGMLGLLTVEAYLDRTGQGRVTHALLRKHRLGELLRDRRTGMPSILRSNVIERDNIMRHRFTKEKLFRWRTVPTDACIELAVDLVIEAIGDVVQPLGDLPMTSWNTFKADATTGRVDGRRIWIAGQALTQKGKVRDSYISALNTVVDMGPYLYPHTWETAQLWRAIVPANADFELVPVRGET